jgi:hypothetical protein
MRPGFTEAWMEREHDETIEDWLLRLRISYAAMAGEIRILVPTGRKTA